MIILWFLLIIFEVNANGLIKCKMSDEECLAKAATSVMPFAAGGKDLNSLLRAAADSYILVQYHRGSTLLEIPKLEPLHIPSMHINPNGGNIHLHQIYEDLHIYGLTGLKFTKVKPNLQGSNCGIHLDGNIPIARIESKKLTADGRLKNYDIKGYGPSNVTTYNNAIKGDYHCTKYKVDGVDYLNITSLILDIKPERLHYDFTNLIDGNEAKSNEVLKMMNDNNLEIYKELKEDYERAFADVFKTLAGNVLKRIAYQDLFLPE